MPIIVSETYGAQLSGERLPSEREKRFKITGTDDEDAAYAALSAFVYANFPRLGRLIVKSVSLDEGVPGAFLWEGTASYGKRRCPLPPRSAPTPDLRTLKTILHGSRRPRPTAPRRHVRFGPCRNGGVATGKHGIEGNGLFPIENLLKFFPFPPLFGNAFAVLFGGADRLFSSDFQITQGVGTRRLADDEIFGQYFNQSEPRRAWAVGHGLSGFFLVRF